MKQLRLLKLGQDKKNSFKISRVKNSLKVLSFLLIFGILISLAFLLITRSGTSSYVSQLLTGTALSSTEQQVNVLLLGIAGGAHAGGNLTDTIMVASYNLTTNELYLFSIPRDLWLPSLKSKANAVYEIGLSDNNGLDLAKTVMGNVLGIPIHYGLRMDFRGFVQAIDAIDGIEVEVEKAFDDYLYPIQGAEDDLCGNTEKEMDFNDSDAKKLNIAPGKRTVLVTAQGDIATDSAEEDKGIKYFSCRYEHIKFDKGKTKMSGAVALSFVRSRHATNGEGSDFKRAKRQQKVIEAIKNKVLSLETLTNPQKLAGLIKLLGKSIDTDISPKDAIEFYKLSKSLDKTANFVLDDSPKKDLPDSRQSLLIHPLAASYGGAYVLVSLDDDFSTIQGYIRKILKGEITDDDATAAARPR